jgi:hypothetical protein
MSVLTVVLSITEPICWIIYSFNKYLFNTNEMPAIVLDPGVTEKYEFLCPIPRIFLLKEICIQGK